MFAEGVNGLNMGAGGADSRRTIGSRWYWRLEPIMIRGGADTRHFRKTNLHAPLVGAPIVLRAPPVANRSNGAQHRTDSPRASRTSGRIWRVDVEERTLRRPLSAPPLGGGAPWLSDN